MRVLYYEIQVGFNIFSKLYQIYNQIIKISAKMVKKQNYPVYLNIYDFTSLNPCLNICSLAAYHSGIQINNLQYCYCVVDSNPLVTGVIAIQPQTAQYKFNRKLYLGDITLTQQQIDDVIDELSVKYTCGKYHMFKNNCNHFCDQLLKILIGVGVPNWLFTVTNCLRYLCCCLPHGFVSGLWAIEAIQRQEYSKEDTPLMNIGNK